MIPIAMPKLLAMMKNVLSCGFRAARSLWESATVLAKATGAYLAVLVLCGGAFWAGHVEASHGKRLIRERMLEAEKVAADLARKLDLSLLETARLKAASAARVETPASPLVKTTRRGKPGNIFPGGKE